MSLSLLTKSALFVFIYLSLLSCSPLSTINPPINSSMNHAIKAEECQTGEEVPTQYRMARYRSPTPPCSPHATTLSTEQLQRLIAEETNLVLVDVLAITRRPELDEFGGEWLPNKPRYNIPGSIWLPSVGYGELDAVMDAYFYRELKSLAQGDYSKPIVIYCVIDCWISWNAVKRAASYGYSNLYWYPLGTGGWKAAGFELTESHPVSVIQAE